MIILTCCYSCIEHEKGPKANNKMKYKSNKDRPTAAFGATFTKVMGNGGGSLAGLDTPITVSTSMHWVTSIHYFVMSWVALLEIRVEELGGLLLALSAQLLRVLFPSLLFSFLFSLLFCSVVVCFGVVIFGGVMEFTVHLLSMLTLLVLYCICDCLCLIIRNSWFVCLAPYCCCCCYLWSTFFFIFCDVFFSSQCNWCSWCSCSCHRWSVKKPWLGG